MASLIVTLVLWASAFAAIKVALPAYSPGHLALLRLLVASLSLLIVAPWTKPVLPERRDWAGISVLGLMGFAVYNAALNWGEKTVQAGTASFIVQTAPVWSILLAMLLLGERMKRAAWTGVFVSFAGTLILAVGHPEGLKWQPGAGVILVAAWGTSGYIVLQKKYLARYGAVQLTSYALWAGTFWLLIFSPGLINAVRHAPLNATLAVVFLGVFPSALAYVLWAQVLATMPVARIVTYLYALPGLAVVIAWLGLQEAPTVFSLIGGALALGGVILVNKTK